MSRSLDPMGSRRDISVPDVHVVQVSSRVDHLAGVEQELSMRGLTTVRQDEVYRPPRILEGTKIVVVTDLFDPRCVRALRMARRVGAKTILMMDGITDWRNTFANPRVGDAFLRPAPVDLICCSGMVDCRVLSTLGNAAAPTGLPRIENEFRIESFVQRSGPILVATANNPAFNDEERSRLVDALRQIKQASQWARCQIVWRLTDGLADEVGVRNQEGSLAEAFAGCIAVITTASTLQVEAMRAGKPTAILHPHDTPIWQPAAWVWQPVESQNITELQCKIEPITRGLPRWIDSPERLLGQLARPTKEQMDRQQECLRLTDASSGGASAAELVAEAIAGLAHSKKKPNTSVPLRAIARLPSHKPKRKGRRRVVSIVPFEHSPIGGVTTWSRRLSDAFEHRPDLGYDMHTLLVSTQPGMAHRAADMLDERTSLCILDPTDDHFVTHANLRRAVELHEPDIVMPNFSDLAYAVAMQLRYTGVRTLAVAHTDHGYYKDLMAAYPDWDAAVAVSGTIKRWLGPVAGRRPMGTIVYGVPIADMPREDSCSIRIQITYVGRIARVQKRILDLVPLVNTLAALGIEADMHIVGDGPDQNELAQKLQTTGSVRVVHHGGRSPEWVEAFWPMIDIAVLVSEFEGTSITMLEAMGQGVVPAVTRVESGVGEWIDEGVTGVTAPVGEPETLAHRIAELAADRKKLAEIGRNSWTRVSAELGLDAMAENYARIMNRMMARDIQTRPSLAGVTIGDWPVWMKLQTEDRVGEIAWLRKRLIEAGYRSIEVGTPTDASDAVILTGGHTDPDEAMVRSWCAKGVDVLWSSMIPNGGELAHQLRLLVDKGYTRIAIYGLGQHTKKFTEIIESDVYPIAGFIDDKPPESGLAFGRAAVTPENAMREIKPDCVLLSSDAWEEALWEGARCLRYAGVHVQTIYGTYSESWKAEQVSG